VGHDEHYSHGCLAVWTGEQKSKPSSQRVSPSFTHPTKVPGSCLRPGTAEGTDDGGLVSATRSLPLRVSTNPGTQPGSGEPGLGCAPVLPQNFAGHLGSLLSLCR
jgi:hypothetical protein